MVRGVSCSSSGVLMEVLWWSLGFSPWSPGDPGRPGRTGGVVLLAVRVVMIVFVVVVVVAVLVLWGSTLASSYVVLRILVSNHNLILPRTLQTLPDLGPAYFFIKPQTLNPNP